MNGSCGEKQMRILMSAFLAMLPLTGPAAHAAATGSKPTLTLEGARAALAAALDYAKSHDAPGGAIAVVDDGGNLVALERLDGTFPAASAISIGKARTAAYFKRPTRGIEDAVNKGRFTMTTLPEVTYFTPLAGGVPLTVGGQVIGAVGVSGAASAQQDDEIAQAAADAFAAALARAARAVEHFPAEAVRAAFADGSVSLLANGEFRVNPSRRDGPGEAEIHVADTDIFYVLEGSAVVVTGGEVIAPRSISDSEIRGTAISGGAEQRIASGDVLAIPRGVPHWFKSVQAPFTYYVVKTTATGA
jgi:glc operon protein GlcG